MADMTELRSAAIGAYLLGEAQLKSSQGRARDADAVRFPRNWTTAAAIC